MLGWIGRHGVVTAEQVRRKFFARPGIEGRRAALRRLQILEELGLIRRDATPFASSPRVIRVTIPGARVGEVSVAPARLVESELRHALALVDLVEELAIAYPQAELETERELRQERYRGRVGGERLDARGRCPDALLTMPAGEKIAIELELTPKRSVDYERIFRAYGHEGVDQVWMYVVPRATALVRRVVRETRNQGFVHVLGWKGARTGEPEPERVGRHSRPSAAPIQGA